MKLNDEEKRLLLTIARKSIEEEFGRGVVNFDEEIPESLKKKYGVFVTLTIDGELRGCIGYIIGDKPLYELVYEVAKKAAFEDPRFYPLTEEELDSIEIEISVLTPPKKINSIDEIKIGEHGLIIQKGPFHGLLLPQVATKYNWSVKEFLEHTCLKAGLSKSEWKDPQTKIEIFSAHVFSEKEIGGEQNGDN
ncbi:MAG: AmmeMemoRadiSam system protein A [Ignavibacteria bacterium]|nr:AmmeMemoRadiSam system protein A [Ignavibacteria bacterium]